MVYFLEFFFNIVEPATLIICIIFACKSSKSSKDIRYVKRFVGRNIRYDKKMNKNHIKIAIGLTVGMVASFALPELWYDYLSAQDKLNALILTIGFNINLIFLALTGIAWMVYLDGLLYLRRLRKNGYEVPENKNKYIYLERLPQVEGHSQKEKVISIESIVLAVLCWGMTLMIIIAAVRFWNEHSAVSDIVMYCMVVIAVIVIFWLVSGIVFWRQRLYSKYRDDVELDASRKKRTHIVSGLGFVIGIIIASRVAFMVMDFGADYIERAREQARVNTDVTGNVTRG